MEDFWLLYMTSSTRCTYNWLTEFAETHTAVSLHDILLTGSANVNDATDLRNQLDAGVRVFDLRAHELQCIETIDLFLQSSADIVLVMLRTPSSLTTLPIVSEQTLHMPLRLLLKTTHRLLQLLPEVWLREPRRVRGAANTEKNCFQTLMQSLSHNKLRQQTRLYGMIWGSRPSGVAGRLFHKSKTRNLNRKFLEFAVKNEQSLGRCMNVIFFDSVIDTGIIQLIDMINRAKFDTQSLSDH